MSTIQTAQNRNHQAVPIPTLDFASTGRVAATATPAAFETPTDGIYLVTASGSVYLSVGGTAGDSNGSLFLAGGLPFYLDLKAGDDVSVKLAQDDPAAVFFVKCRG